VAPECAEQHNRLDSRVDHGAGHPPILWCYEIPAATYNCASYYATRASDGKFRLCEADADNDNKCDQGALIDPCNTPSPPPPPSAPPVVQHEVTAVGGVYLVDGSSTAFAVTPGSVARYNIPASHPLRIYGQDLGCDPTWVAVDGVTSGMPDHHWGLWELTYPTTPSCYPLTMYCQYHGVMGSADRLLAATPPSPPPAAPPAAPITCPAGATSDSLDALGPLFTTAGATTHFEDLPGTGATILFESVQFQCWCGTGLLYELQVDDGTTGTWATVRQCQVANNVGLGNCPEMPSLANPLTTSYDVSSSWRLRVTNPQQCSNNRLNTLNTAYCLQPIRRRQLSFLQRLFGNGDLDTRSAHTLRRGNSERF